ncbi:MAG: MBL fold metallo-hydrolase [Gammaproteobacteria bacterium]|nr:MBL fold metallo-hydrolase [Gammaproteobacteria bacterium]
MRGRWATVGNALENARIDVEDLDRNAATYYVYYDDAEVREPGFLRRLFTDGDDEHESGSTHRTRCIWTTGKRSARRERKARTRPGRCDRCRKTAEHHQAILDLTTAGIIIRTHAIASLGSGSRGNATIIEDGNTCVLIDLGFSLKETVSRLKRLGREPEDVAAVLVTHEHADHIHGVATFARKHGDTGIHDAGHLWWRREARQHSRLEPVNCHRRFRIGGLEIEPVPVPHDAREPCQYIVSSGGRRVGMLTDLGHVTPFVEERYRDCDALLLECNHDVDMLAAGPDPMATEAAGRWQPWSPEQWSVSGLASVRSSSGDFSTSIVCHISEQNNKPELAVDALEPELAHWSGELHVARQQQRASTGSRCFKACQLSMYTVLYKTRLYITWEQSSGKRQAPMKIRHIRSLDLWLLSKGNRVLYRGKDNPWR